jgi:hypothetical protein
MDEIPRNKTVLIYYMGIRQFHVSFSEQVEPDKLSHELAYYNVIRQPYYVEFLSWIANKIKSKSV